MPDRAPNAPEPDPAQQNGLDDERPRRHYGVAVLRIIGWTLTAVVAVLLLFYIFLQTEMGEQVAKNYIENRVNKTLDNAEIYIDDLEGNIIGHISLYDIRLITDEGETLARIDTLSASYRLLALLKNRLHLYDVYLGNPSVWMEQEADGSWDLFNVVRSDSASVDTTKEEAALVVQLDSLTMRNASAEAAFYARGSPLHAYGLHLQLSDVHLGPSLRVGVDTAWGAMNPPAHPDEEVTFRMGGRLDEGRVYLRGLRLESPNSDVFAEGTLLLPEGPDTPLRDVDFTLSAAPLAFHDVAPLLPFLNAAGRAEIDARFEGTGRRLDADVDLRLGDGGIARMDGVIAREDGTLAYDMDLVARQLNAGYVLAEGPLESLQLNADAAVDLAGTSLQTLDGRADVEMFDTRYGRQYIRNATLTSTFDRGNARVDLSANLRGGEIDAAGSVLLRAAQPGYQFEGSFRNVRLGDLLQNPQQESDLNGSFSLEGEGFDMQYATMEGRAALTNSTLNGSRIETGIVEFSLRDGDLYIDADLFTPSGNIVVRGIITFLEDEIQFAVREGRFENLDVSLFTGSPTTTSNLTGTFTATGTLVGGEPPVIDADISVAEGAFLDYRLTGAAFDLSLSNDVLTMTGDLDMAEGNLYLAGTIRFAGESITYRITQGSFENLDLADITGDPSVTSSLTGTFTAYGSGVDLAALSLTADVQLQDGRFNRQNFEEGSLILDLAQGRLAFTARLQTPEGGFTIIGTSNLLADEITVAISEGAFRNLNVGALLDLAWLDTQLNGTLYVEDGPIALRTGSFTIVADLDNSSINDAALEDGLVRASFNAGYVNAEASLDFAQGRAQFIAEGAFFVSLGLQQGYRLEGAADSLDLAALADNDTLRSSATFSFELSGAGVELRDMRLEGEVLAEHLALEEDSVTHLASDFLLDDGVLYLDTLNIESTFAEAAGSGRLVLFEGAGARTSDFVVDATIESLAPLRPFLPVDQLAIEEGEIMARVTGTRETLRFVAAVEATSFVYGDIRVANFNGRAVGRLDSLRIMDNVEIAAETDFFSIPAITIANTQLEATYTDDAVVFDAEMMVDSRRNLNVAGRVNITPEANLLRFERLRARLDGDQWRLLQPATIRFGEVYRVSNFLLYSDGQQIAIDGVIDPDGEQNLVATIESFRIGAVADLLGYDDLGGRVGGSIVLTGPAASPNLDGRLLFDLTAQGEAVGEGVATVTYRRQRLVIDAELQNEAGGTLIAEGGLPIDLRFSTSDTLQTPLRVQTQFAEDQQIDLVLQADSFALGWVVEPFLDADDYEQIGGYVSGDVAITGTFQDPLVEGDFRVSDGFVRLTATEVTYHDITGTARLDGNQVFVERMVMQANGGELVASGSIRLSQLTLGEFDLDVALTEYLLIDTRQRRVVASGDLQVTGTTDRPVVTGFLRVLSADIYLEGAETEVEVVALTPQDLRMLEGAFGIRVTEQEARAFDLYQALALDLEVELETDTWIRARANPEMNIQITGRLDVYKDPLEEEQLFGVIEISEERSYINQFARRFSITEGVIRFNGPLSEALIDARAVLSVPVGGSLRDEVALVLNVSGRVSNLELNLSSAQDAPIEGSAILSSLVFGSTTAANLAITDVLQQQGAIIAFSQATTILEGFAGQELGLDVVEISYDAILGTTLTAGKYFRIDPLPRPVFAAVRQPISEVATSVGTGEGTELTLEYGLLEWLLMRMAVRQGAFRFDLFSEYSY